MPKHLDKGNCVARDLRDFRPDYRWPVPTLRVTCASCREYEDLKGTKAADEWKRRHRKTHLALVFFFCDTMTDHGAGIEK